jgi:hypothetical protein
MSPNDLLHRRRRYEQKLDAMTVKKLKQACRDRSLAVGGTKTVLLMRLKASGNANGKNTAGKAKRKKAGGKRKISKAQETQIHAVDGHSSKDFEQRRPPTTTVDDSNSDSQDLSEKRPQTPHKRKRDAKRNPSMAALRPRLRGGEGHQTGLTKTRLNYTGL